MKLHSPSVCVVVFEGRRLVFELGVPRRGARESYGSLWKSKWRRLTLFVKTVSSSPEHGSAERSHRCETSLLLYSTCILQSLREMMNDCGRKKVESSGHDEYKPAKETGEVSGMTIRWSDLGVGITLWGTITVGEP